MSRFISALFSILSVGAAVRACIYVYILGELRVLLTRRSCTKFVHHHFGARINVMIYLKWAEAH